MSSSAVKLISASGGGGYDDAGFAITLYASPYTTADSEILKQTDFNENTGKFIAQYGVDEPTTLCWDYDEDTNTLTRESGRDVLWDHSSNIKLDPGSTAGTKNFRATNYNDYVFCWFRYYHYSGYYPQWGGCSTVNGNLVWDRYYEFIGGSSANYVSCCEPLTANGIIVTAIGYGGSGSDIKQANIGRILNSNGAPIWHRSLYSSVDNSARYYVPTHTQLDEDNGFVYVVGYGEIRNQTSGSEIWCLKLNLSDGTVDDSFTIYRPGTGETRPKGFRYDPETNKYFFVVTNTTYYASSRHVCLTIDASDNSIEGGFAIRYTSGTSWGTTNVSFAPDGSSVNVGFYNSTSGEDGVMMISDLGSYPSLDRVMTTTSSGARISHLSGHTASGHLWINNVYRGNDGGGNSRFTTSIKVPHNLTSVTASTVLNSGSNDTAFAYFISRSTSAWSIENNYAHSLAIGSIINTAQATSSIYSNTSTNVDDSAPHTLSSGVEWEPITLA